MTIRLLACALFLTLAAFPDASALGRQEGAIRKSWEFPEGVSTLVVETDRQDVVFRAGGPRVTGRLIGDSDDVVRASQEGSTVRIHVHTDRNLLSWRLKSARLELSIPPNMAVEVTTASGGIQVLVPTSSVFLRSASGNIEAEEGQAADVDSASGDLRLSGFQGPIKASTLSGDLQLDNSSGLIRANTLSGDLEGDNLSPEAKSRFTTVSGTVKLGLTPGPKAFRIRAETVSGDLEVAGQSAQRTLETGEGPSLSIQTVSGDVRVK